MQALIPDTFDDFSSDAPAETPPVETAVVEAAPVEEPAVEGDGLELEEAPVEEPPAEAARERNADGTFKPKEADAAKSVDSAEKPKVKAAKPRIDHLTWEREQARREAAEARAETARLRAELDARTPAPKRPATEPEPDPSDATKYPEGQYDRGYLKDQARWEARQEFAQQQAEARARWQQEQTARAIETRQSQFVERMRTDAAGDPELLSRVHPEILNLRPSHTLAAGERPTAQTAMADALLDAESPARLMLYLSEHPDDYRRLAALHPIQVIREIGKIEARLDTAPPGSVSRPSISQAKPPMKPVGSAAPIAVEDLDLSTDGDLDRHVRVYNQADRAKAGTRR